MYQQFDWECFSKITNNKKFLWLSLNHNKIISEKEYIIKHKELKQYSKTLTNKNKIKRYTPSNLKKEYKNLKEKFNFFTGEL